MKKNIFYLMLLLALPLVIHAQYLGGNGRGDVKSEILKDSSLPVTLTDFSAKVVSNGVILNWITESEIENLGFIIEKRRQETGDWKQVAGYLTDKGLEGYGSTTEKHDYQFTDNAVQPGVTYAYRLGDVDYSGKVIWHKEVEVKVEDLKVGRDFHLDEVYPNPFNAAFTIPLTLGKSSPVRITLCDLNGKVVKVITNGIKPAGEYRIAVDCRELSSGIYFLMTTIMNQNSAKKIVLIK